MTSLTTSRFKFFLPNARILNDSEIANLSPEKRKAEESGRQDGLWIEIICPDESCIDKEGNITIPAKGAKVVSENGVFLSLFCPNDSCEVVQSTDLP